MIMIEMMLTTIIIKNPNRNVNNSINTASNAINNYIICNKKNSCNSCSDKYVNNCADDDFSDDKNNYDGSLFSNINIEYVG